MATGDTRAVTTETRLRALARSWRDDAKRRRAMSARDQSADVLEYCASELDSELRDTHMADDELTVAEYAELHSRSVATIRRWCASNLIPCRPVGREYRIRRDTPCPDLRARSA